MPRQVVLLPLAEGEQQPVVGGGGREANQDLEWAPGEVGANCKEIQREKWYTDKEQVEHTEENEGPAGCEDKE